MICYLLKRKSPLTNGIQPLTAKTDINFWTFLWTPIQAVKPGAHSLKFSCVLRGLFIEKKRCGIVWQATDLMVQIQLDGWNPRAPRFFSRTAVLQEGRKRDTYSIHGSITTFMLLRPPLPAPAGSDGWTDAPTGRYPCGAASFPSRFCIYCACDSSCRQYAACTNWDKRPRYTLTFIACIAGKLSIYPVFHNRISV